MMFSLMRSIVFNTLGPLSFIYKSHIFLFPAVFALRNFQVHICTTNSGNMVSYIETSINKLFALLLLWIFYMSNQIIAISNLEDTVTNFIQLISPQPVDRFSQTKLRWKALNEGYPHICGMYKSNNKRLRYQAISSCQSFVC